MQQQQRQRETCGPIPWNDQTDGLANISRGRRFCLDQPATFIETILHSSHRERGVFIVFVGGITPFDT